jgi:hypothetical protein
LVAGLGGEAEDAGAAQALDAMSQADLIDLLGSIKGARDRDLLALLQGLAGGFLGGADQELDLPQAELAIGVKNCSENTGRMQPRTVGLPGFSWVRVPPEGRRDG